MSQIRTRWAAVGAAVAVTLGAGGIGLVDAAKEDGARPVYTAITTCRILDTRPLHMIGAKTEAFEPEETLTVPGGATMASARASPTMWSRSSSTSPPSTPPS
jgi:hypothetical protein